MFHWPNHTILQRKHQWLWRSCCLPPPHPHEGVTFRNAPQVGEISNKLICIWQPVFTLDLFKENDFPRATGRPVTAALRLGGTAEPPAVQPASSAPVRMSWLANRSHLSLSMSLCNSTPSICSLLLLPNQSACSFTALKTSLVKQITIHFIYVNPYFLQSQETDGQHLYNYITAN